MSSKPVMLIIFDGLGCDANGRPEGNAFKQAETPTLDRLIADWPWSHVEASHRQVGLPDGQMGNSEVGHLNMGAGRVVFQDLVRVSNALADGTLAQAPEFKQWLETSDKLHFMGLLSDGGVHSHIDHLSGLIDAAIAGAPGKEINIHCFLDGRDTPPESAQNYVAQLQEKIASLGADKNRVHIRSIIGRMYAMDRDTNWERTKKAYDLMTTGAGTVATDPVQAVKDSYAAGVTDEFMEPIAVRPDGQKASDGTIGPGEGIFFFNFRADRARQITRAFKEGADWTNHFERPLKPEDVHYLCLSEYHEDFNLPVVFKKESYPNLLGEVLAKNGLKQLRIAETEKYAHVTFFFNGGSDTAFSGEERILIPSPKVRTYDLKPEMSAYEVTDALVQAIEDDKFDFIVLNFANPDMVGHTGILEAATKAVTSVDECLGRILSKLDEKGGSAFLTADHGNCEKMFEDGSQNPHTAHTTNQVFFIAYGKGCKGLKLKDGKLADIAPTLLDFMGVSIPEEMTGDVLIERAAAPA